MIAVSSHRPHSESGEYRYNQIRAKESWVNAFDQIVYFGPPEPELECLKTKFVPSEQFPKIKALAEYCSTLNGWSAIVNADIFIGPTFKSAESELVARRGKCAVSLRNEFVPPQIPFCGRRVDLGLDFFAATHGMWKFIASEIPDQFHIGHGFWDTWMLAFMAKWGGRDCYDLTPQRFVFHPRHGDRKTVHHIDTSGYDITNHLQWPKGRLRCFTDH